MKTSAPLANLDRAVLIQGAIPANLRIEIDPLSLPFLVRALGDLWMPGGAAQNSTPNIADIEIRQFKFIGIFVTPGQGADKIDPLLLKLDYVFPVDEVPVAQKSVRLHLFILQPFY